MKRLSISFVLAALAAAGWITSSHAQGQSAEHGHPFWDRSDTGEIIHVLPPEASIHSPHDTQPTFADPSSGSEVNPASYGSGNLIDHGGPRISNAGFQAVYWNTQASDSRQATVPYTTIKAQISAFISSFSDGVNWDDSLTDDYTIIQQYGSSSTPISATLAQDQTTTDHMPYVDRQPTSKSIQDSKIRSYLASLFNAGKLFADGSVVYGVYLPPGMKVSLQGGASCSSFCGYHGHFTWNGIDIKYATFPYLNCSACSIGGLSVADMLTIVTSHEIREAVTDPDLNAWYDAAGYEADDKCAWHNLYQMTTGGFWVQPEYSNGLNVGGTAYRGPGCIVPNR